jgi:hypothetical protein
MFSNVVSKHEAPCGNREALATGGTQEYFEGSSDIEIKEKESNSKNIPH